MGFWVQARHHVFGIPSNWTVWGDPRFANLHVGIWGTEALNPIIRRSRGTNLENWHRKSLGFNHFESYRIWDGHFMTWQVKLWPSYEEVKKSCVWYYLMVQNLMWRGVCFHGTLQKFRRQRHHRYPWLRVEVDSCPRLSLVWVAFFFETGSNKSLDKAWQNSGSMSLTATGRINHQLL